MLKSVGRTSSRPGVPTDITGQQNFSAQNFDLCGREEKNSRDSLFSLFTRAENTRAAIIITSSTTIIMKGNPKE